MWLPGCWACTRYDLDVSNCRVISGEWLNLRKMVDAGGAGDRREGDCLELKIQIKTSMSSFTKMPIYSAHGNADEYKEVFLKKLADSPPEASYQPNTENNNQLILTEII